MLMMDRGQRGRNRDRGKRQGDITRPHMEDGSGTGVTKREGRKVRLDRARGFRVQNSK